jgi:hypothetical protein
MDETTDYPHGRLCDLIYQRLIMCIVENGRAVNSALQMARVARRIVDMLRS